MIFTVVRAVREADSTGPEFGDRLQRLVKTPPPPIAPASMDLPHAGELLHLDLSDFASTTPGALE